MICAICGVTDLLSESWAYAGGWREWVGEVEVFPHGWQCPPCVKECAVIAPGRFRALDAKREYEAQILHEQARAREARALDIYNARRCRQCSIDDSSPRFEGWSNMIFYKGGVEEFLCLDCSRKNSKEALSQQQERRELAKRTLERLDKEEEARREAEWRNRRPTVWTNYNERESERDSLSGSLPEGFKTSRLHIFGATPIWDMATSRELTFYGEGAWEWTPLMYKTGRPMRIG